MIFSASAQLNISTSIGISNFRKVMPYTGTIVNHSTTLLAGGTIGYKFKNKPLSIDLNAAYFTSNNWEETFEGGFKRAYARYYKQQNYSVHLNYFFYERKKINAFAGTGVGYFKASPKIFYVHSNNPTEYWGKINDNRFSFGAKTGLVLGKDRFRTKIELNHFFLSNYDFAGFASEMNTSITLGIMVLL